MRYSFDYIIIGAGFSGAVVAERIAAILNKKVLLIDRRNHVAGNCYDYYDNYGVLIQKYGPHIFHTSNRNVWEYLSEFTSNIAKDYSISWGLSGLLGII